MAENFHDSVASTIDEVISNNSLLQATSKYICKSYYPYMNELIKSVQKIIENKDFVCEEHMTDLEKIFKGMQEYINYNFNREISVVMRYMFFLDDNFIIPIYTKIVDLYKKIIELGKLFFPDTEVINPLGEWLQSEKLYPTLRSQFHEFWKSTKKINIPDFKETYELYLHPSKHKLRTEFEELDDCVKVKSLPSGKHVV